MKNEQNTPLPKIHRDADLLVKCLLVMLLLGALFKANLVAKEQQIYNLERQIEVLKKGE